MVAWNPLFVGQQVAHCFNQRFLFVFRFKYLILLLLLVVCFVTFHFLRLFGSLFLLLNVWGEVGPTCSSSSSIYYSSYYVSSSSSSSSYYSSSFSPSSSSSSSFFLFFFFFFFIFLFCCCCWCFFCCCICLQFDIGPVCFKTVFELMIYFSSLYVFLLYSYYSSSSWRLCSCFWKALFCKGQGCNETGNSLATPFSKGHINNALVYVRGIQEGITAEPSRNDLGAHFEWNDAGFSPKVRVTSQSRSCRPKVGTYSQGEPQNPNRTAQERNPPEWGLGVSAENPP